MIKLEDFTNKELINAIAEWYESQIGEAWEPFEILEMIRNGEWLEWHNDRIKGELK